MKIYELAQGKKSSKQQLDEISTGFFGQMADKIKSYTGNDPATKGMSLLQKSELLKRDAQMVALAKATAANWNARVANAIRSNGNKPLSAQRYAELLQGYVDKVLFKDKFEQLDSAPKQQIQQLITNLASKSNETDPKSIATVAAAAAKEIPQIVLTSMAASQAGDAGFKPVALTGGVSVDDNDPFLVVGFKGAQYALKGDPDNTWVAYGRYSPALDPLSAEALTKKVNAWAQSSPHANDKQKAALTAIMAKPGDFGASGTKGLAAGGTTAPAGSASTSPLPTDAPMLFAPILNVLKSNTDPELVKYVDALQPTGDAHVDAIIDLLKKSMPAKPAATPAAAASPAAGPAGSAATPAPAAGGTTAP